MANVERMAGIRIQDRTIKIMKINVTEVLPIPWDGGMHFVKPMDLDVVEVDSIKCDRCKCTHLVDDDSDGFKLRYITIIGNVSANSGGGILGNGDWGQFGIPVSHYCVDCLQLEIRKWAEE